MCIYIYCIYIYMLTPFYNNWIYRAEMNPHNFHSNRRSNTQAPCALVGMVGKSKYTYIYICCLVQLVWLFGIGSQVQKNEAIFTRVSRKIHQRVFDNHLDVNSTHRKSFISYIYIYDTDIYLHILICTCIYDICIYTVYVYIYMYVYM